MIRVSSSSALHSCFLHLPNFLDCIRHTIELFHSRFLTYAIWSDARARATELWVHLSRRARNQQNIRRKRVHQQRVDTITDKCVGSSSRIQPPCPCFQPPRVSKLGCSVLGPRKIARCAKHMTGAHEYLSASLSEHGTLLVDSETTTTTMPPDVPPCTATYRFIPREPGWTTDPWTSIRIRPGISRSIAEFIANYNYWR